MEVRIARGSRATRPIASACVVRTGPMPPMAALPKTLRIGGRPDRAPRSPGTAPHEQCFEMMQAGALTSGKTWPRTCSGPGMDEARDGIHGKPEPSRALVPVEGDGRVPASGGIRPLATFLAQIMACEAGVAEFRRHRRAEPLEASARYARTHQGPRP